MTLYRSKRLTLIESKIKKQEADFLLKTDRNLYNMRV